jgi:hypothetical protein
MLELARLVSDPHPKSSVLLSTHQTIHYCSIEDTHTRSTHSSFVQEG